MSTINPAPRAPSGLSGEAARTWELFTDWCAVRDLPALPTTLDVLARFVDEVPAKRSTQVRRLGAIRRVHKQTNCPLEPPPPPPRPRPWRAGEGWLSLPEALERIPTTGGRVAWAGRRDAWLLVLLGHVGLHRDQARNMSTEQITASPAGVSVDGVQVPIVADNPAGCLACAVTRWLRVVHLAHDAGTGQGNSPVLYYLAEQRPRADEHDCAHELPAGWKATKHLLPPINQHGHYEKWPLSKRAITSIVAHRLDPDTAVQAPTARRPAPGHDAGESEVSREESWARLNDASDALDEQDERIEETTKRLSQLLDDSTAMLDHLHSLNQARGRR